MRAIGAYLFIRRFLAHANDGRISVEEWHALSQRPSILATHLEVAPGDWGLHVEEAAATYDALLKNSGPGGVLRQFHRCVATVRDAYAHDAVLRQELIAACRAVVEADGTADPMEEHFMAQITSAWMGRASITRDEPATPMDLLEAYLYIKRFLAEVADGHLHELEWTDIQEQLVLRGAALGATAARCRDALAASSLRFRRLREAGPDAVLVHFRQCADALQSALDQGNEDPNGLIHLLDELWRLADADGFLDPREKVILQDLEARWLSHL